MLKLTQPAISRHIQALEQELRVRLLATSASCPMSDVLLEDALDALTAALRRHKPADMPPLLLNVDIDWDTTWTPERMAPALRERLARAR